jgi:hypothetical protein
MTDEESKKLGGCIAVLLFAPVAIALAAIMKGWALSKLWMWFIVDIFHLPPLSMGQAYGLALVISYLTHQVTNCQEKEEELSTKIVGMIIGPVIAALVTVGIGWCMVQLMK